MPQPHMRKNPASASGLNAREDVSVLSICVNLNGRGLMRPRAVCSCVCFVSDWWSSVEWWILSFGLNPIFMCCSCLERDFGFNLSFYIILFNALNKLFNLDCKHTKLDTWSDEVIISCLYNNLILEFGIGNGVRIGVDKFVFLWGSQLKLESKL